MTIALCTNCGNIKNGTLLRCEFCGCGSTGNPGYDIAFSDHYLSEKTLREFGHLISKLRNNTHDEAAAFWAFSYFITKYFPEIAISKIPSEYIESAKSLLDKVELENIIVEDSPRIDVKPSSVEEQYSTKVRHHIIECPKCSSTKSCAIWYLINGSLDQWVKSRVMNGKIFQNECISCGYSQTIAYDTVYFEFDKREIAIFLNHPLADPYFKIDNVPKSLFENLSPEFIFREVHHFLDLIEKIMIFDDGLNDIRVENAKLMLSMQRGFDITDELFYDRLESKRFRGEKFIFRNPKENFEEVSLSLKGKKKQERYLLSKLKEELSKSNREWHCINQVYILKLLGDFGILKRLL